MHVSNVSSTPLHLCGTLHGGDKPRVLGAEIVARHGNPCFKVLIVNLELMERKVATKHELQGMCTVLVRCVWFPTTK